MAWDRTNIVGFSNWQIYKTLKRNLVKKVGNKWIADKEVVFKISENNHAEYEILSELSFNLDGEYIMTKPVMQKDGSWKPGVDGTIQVTEEYVDKNTIQFRFKVVVERYFVENYI